MSKKWIKFLLCILVGAVIWFLPIPAGIKVPAWHLMAIFVATILAFILQPFSIGIVTFIALTVSALTGVLKPGEALNGFSSGVVWLIVSAFLFSRGFIKSGLGRRIAYVLMKRFGDSSLKLGYTLAISNLIISPAIPSNTARAGGIMFPIVRSLAGVFGSEPGSTARKIGAYLVQTVYQADNVACAITMTAMAGNLLMVTFAAKTVNITLTWGMWAAAAIIPGLISIAVIPYFLYKYYPPELKKTPEAKEVAAKELDKMGAMTLQEKILTAVFIGAIIGWGTSQFTGFDATIVAMAAVCIMMLSGIISWDDVITEKGAWDAMIWMGGIFGLADNLAKLGLFSVFAQSVSSALTGVSWVAALITVFLIYIYSTYGFASGVAHITSMYPAFLAVAITTGAPPYLAALLLAFGSGLYQGLTHYASGPSAIFFGGGYIDQGTWWRLGFMVLLVNLLIWGTIGPVWWKVMGLW
ncbi:anion permease [Sporomusa acidovorans]|uniref:Malate transporter YflS n=1 Tax=Sporomusa acidovorans (strain ATCC 49682 / DSM 3132 / Mol) TaxID=1123286 RepID=A0ABZ3J1D9_SPOA4|nr:anion permease [Sporomusa acidovorans]OZC24136.1 putative malate transporter YflS [Sporomusa acidovorans DSM 3132]SDF36764.1 divalent anion:Na+ symporter, DASS family [Sporomusa acidovorans]